MNFLFIIWYIVTIVQTFLGIGTAYRYTKAGGDNGFSLFGWMFLFELAAAVPYLGYHLWKKSFDYEKKVVD